jgi:hypothetical protein
VKALKVIIEDGIIREEVTYISSPGLTITISTQIITDPGERSQGRFLKKLVEVIYSIFRGAYEA